MIRNNDKVKEGIFISGFTSKELYDKIKKPFPGPRMVFIMKVTEKIPLHSYWNDPRFECKKPPKIVIGTNAYIDNNQTPPMLMVGNKDEVIKYVGDNIYEPVTTGGDNHYFIHHDNINHPCKYRQRDEIIQLDACQWCPCDNQFFEIIDPDLPLGNYNKYRKYIKQDGTVNFIDLISHHNNTENIAQHDLKGLKVLVSNDFFYFGKDPIDVIKDFKVNIPEFSTSHGVITTRIENLWNYLNQTYKPKVVLNNPHCWPYP
jgi:hypothetical protein